MNDEVRSKEHRAKGLEQGPRGMGGRYPRQKAKVKSLPSETLRSRSNDVAVS